MAKRGNCLYLQTIFFHPSLSSLQRGSQASDLGVNKGIQVVAQQYCVECKDIYHKLSMIIQNVLASRRELVKYDTQKGEGLVVTTSVSAPVPSPGPSLSQPSVSPPGSLADSIRGSATCTKLWDALLL